MPQSPPAREKVLLMTPGGPAVYEVDPAAIFCRVPADVARGHRLGGVEFRRTGESHPVFQLPTFRRRRSRRS